MNEPYYLAYEKRYKKVFEAGIEKWGHTSDDSILYSILLKWINDNDLKGKRIIDFACGEGAGGELLSKFGCIYQGVDISPSVIEKASITLKNYSNVSVSIMDMVNDQIVDKYDGAIDIMGLHMLILDIDREKYLKNAFNCLKNNAPMLFFREMHDENSIKDKIDSMEQWIRITGNDYITPKIRKANQNNMDIEVSLPLVPGRARLINGYIQEFKGIGFIIEDIVEMETNTQVQNSVSIFARKPNIF